MWFSSDDILKNWLYLKIKLFSSLNFVLLQKTFLTLKIYLFVMWNTVLPKYILIVVLEHDTPTYI